MWSREYGEAHKANRRHENWNYLWYRLWVFPSKFTKKRAVVTVPRVVAHRAHGHSAYARSGR